MPTIAIVDGVRIVFWPNDHPPPHVHASIGGDEARISIETGRCLSGALPRSKMQSVLAWLEAHRDEGRVRLVRDAGRARSGSVSMTGLRITAVEVPRYPVVRLTFDDGFAGEIDLQPFVDRGPFFEPLRDERFFATVSVAAGGRAFGWRLDEIGGEIDFGADSARADIETALVEERAERYRRHLRSAAAE